MFRTTCALPLIGFLATASAEVPRGHLHEAESRFLPGLYGVPLHPERFDV